MMMRTSLFIWAVFLTGGALAQNIWYVDATRPDNNGPGTSIENAWQIIQTAIDNPAAVDGDLILVAPGIYNQGGVAGANVGARVDINKAVTVQAISTNPADTVITGQPDPITGSHGDSAKRGVNITPLNSYLIGFTITGGYTGTNGHVNNATDQHGGGISHSGLTGNGTVINCVITGNSANLRGGGVYARSGTLTLIDCVVSSNNAGTAGGGAVNVFSYDCEIFHNTAVATGGGVGGGEHHRCVLWGNTSGTGGGGGYGGIYFSCLIYGNAAGGDGGGIGDGGPAVNCTFTGNYAGGGGGAARYSYITNCIVWDNNADGADKELRQMRSVVQTCAKAGITHGVDGNITNSPLFINYGTGYGLDHIPGNYRLQWSNQSEKRSPCIDSGLNQDWMTGTYDLDGNPRIINGVVDRGAYEYVPPPRGTIVIVL